MFFLLISLTLYAQLIDGVAILVKNEPITLSEVRKSLNEHAQNVDKTIEALIRKKLESQEAKERKITVSSQEVYEDIEKMAEQNKMTVRELHDNMHSVRNTTSSELKAKIHEKLLNQKLYNAIAFSHMDQPTEDEEAEYYQVHIDEFSQPESFSVIVYRSASKERLSEKINNPMFYSPEVSSENKTFYYEGMNPKLVKLLNKTEANSFTPIVSIQQAYISFFVQEKGNIVTQPLDKVRNQIANAMTGDKRQQILNDYFARLRLNADIQIIRLPKQ